MNLLPSIELIDLAIYIKTKSESALVISDIHIGYEEALNKQGVLIPRIQFEDIIQRLELIFSQIKAKERKLDTIIVNGDLKHEFGTISEQEWRNTLKFIDILTKHSDNVVLIKGNHDSILEPIAKKRKVKVVNSYVIKPLILQETTSAKRRTDGSRRLTKATMNLILKKLNLVLSSKKETGDILITHGDKLPKESELEGIGTIIIGHEHPAVSLRDGPRAETFKCYLKGKFKGKNLIVQPSFNTLVSGNDILKEKILSPFLKQDLDNFKVFAVEDKVYEFGKVKNLR